MQAQVADAVAPARPYILILFPKDHPEVAVGNITREVYATLNGQGTPFTSADAFKRFQASGGNFGGWGAFAGMGRLPSGEATYDVIVVVENGDGFVGKGNYDVVAAALQAGRPIAVWRDGRGVPLVRLDTVEHDRHDPDYNKKLAWQNYSTVVTAEGGDEGAI